MRNKITKKKFFSEGKTKKIYSTENPHEIILHYKDNITALDGEKTEFIQDKGILINEITTSIFKFLNFCGIKTHFIRRINNREQLCVKVDMIPLEFVVRNIISGSLSKRLGVKEGTHSTNMIFEIFYKNDALNDPFINDHHAVFLEIISYEELKKIYKIILNINNILKKYFLEKNILLVDFKMEFGKNENNQILLSDEISPDTCRFWDKKTMKKLDKDLFRIGRSSSSSSNNNNNSKEVVFDAYMEVLKRLNIDCLH